MVQLLLEAGARQKEITEHGQFHERLLIDVVWSKILPPKMLKLLLDNGGDAHDLAGYYDFEGTALEWLMRGRRTDEHEERRVEMTKMLLDLGASVSPLEIGEVMTMPCIFAAASGFCECLTLLLKEKTCDLECQHLDPNGLSDHMCGMLHLASRAGHVETVKLLLISRIDPNFRTSGILQVFEYHGCTALHYMGFDIKNADRGCGELDVEKIPKEVANSLEIIKLLVFTRADINATMGDNKWTPFHVLARNGTVFELCQFLVKKGIDVNRKDKRGRTALHLAVLGDIANWAGEDRKLRPEWVREVGKAEGVDMVRLLLENGVYAKEKMDDGCTALDIACELGYIEIARLLIGLDLKVLRQKWNWSVYEGLRGIGRGRYASIRGPYRGPPGPNKI